MDDHKLLTEFNCCGSQGGHHQHPTSS